MDTASWQDVDITADMAGRFLKDFLYLQYAVSSFAQRVWETGEESQEGPIRANS